MGFGAIASGSRGTSRAATFVCCLAAYHLGFTAVFLMILFPSVCVFVCALFFTCRDCANRLLNALVTFGTKARSYFRRSRRCDDVQYRTCRTSPMFFQYHTYRSRRTLTATKRSQKPRAAFVFVVSPRMEHRKILVFVKLMRAHRRLFKIIPSSKSLSVCCTHDFLGTQYWKPS